MPKKSENPFLTAPSYPNRKRRSKTHDYRREAKYMVTIMKNQEIPRFSKITGSARIIEGVDVPTVELLSGREYIEEALAIWKEKFQQIWVAEYVIMPDHIHLCLDVRSYLPEGLSRAIAQLMGKISSFRHMMLPENIRPGQLQPVFEKGFNDSIARISQQWESQKRYVRDNPRRYLLKKENPDYMLKNWIISFGESNYIAKGNIFLLKEPHLLPVKHKRIWSHDESDKYQKDCMMMIDNGSIPISPYIHKKEKEIRDYSVATGSPYIRICENGFSERETAQGREVDLMAEGRLLLIAPCKYNNRKMEMDYDRAHQLNDIAFQLSEICNNGALGALRPF